MKKNFKRILSFVLALVMAFSLTACLKAPNVGTNGDNGNDKPPADYFNETGYPICDEPITIRVGGSVGSTLNWQNTYLVKYVEEKLGIKMICEPVAADAIDTQYSQWLSASGTMPDLVINCSFDRSQVDGDGDDGYWLDIAKYKNLMPNMYSFFEQYPALENLVTTQNGNIYSLTRITTTATVAINNWLLLCHTPTMKAAGVDITKIRTTEDFYQALKKLKAKYPYMTPLMLAPDVASGYRTDLNLRTAFGVYSNENSYMVNTDANGKVYLEDISDNHREYLKYINRLAKEGLIDLNDFAKAKDEITTDIVNGNYGFWTGVFKPVTEFDKELHEMEDFGWREDYSWIWGLTSEGQTDQVTYIQNNGVLNQAKVMINANTRYPEAIVRLLDFFFSEEGQMIAIHGEEGVTYDWEIDEVTGMKSVNYEAYYDEANYTTPSMWHIQTVSIYEAFAFNWGFVGTVDGLTDEELAEIPFNSKFWWDAQKLLRREEVDNYVISEVPVIYTGEQIDEMGTLKTDLTMFLATAKAEFMAGIRDPYSDADWNAFVNQVNAMGWKDTLQQIEQDARS